jgi:hypothetical protein
MKISPCGSVFVPAICTLTSSFRFPLQARGTTVWFPPPAGGTCRRGQKLHTNLPCTRWAGKAGVPARNGNRTPDLPLYANGVKATKRVCPTALALEKLCQCWGLNT